jgi:hypothetical protein
MKSKIGLSILTLALTLTLPLHASKKVAPPNREDMLGNWFGFEESGLEFCRLELNDDGTGLFAYVFVNDNVAELHSIKEWSLTGINIKFETETTDPHDFAITLTGVGGAHLMRLDMAGVGMKWKHRLTLYNEKEFLSRNEKVKEAIEASKSKRNKDASER